MMRNSLVEALEKALHLSQARCLCHGHLQEELAKQLIEDIESEIQWQQTLSQPQSSSGFDFSTVSGFLLFF